MERRIVFGSDNHWIAKIDESFSSKSLELSGVYFFLRSQ